MLSENARAANRTIIPDDQARSDELDEPEAQPTLMVVPLVALAPVTASLRPVRGADCAAVAMVRGEADRDCGDNLWTT